MMDKPLNIDYERMTATVSLNDDSPKVLVVSEGRARLYEIDDYGEFFVKTQGGKVSYIKNGLTDKF